MHRPVLQLYVLFLLYHSVEGLCGGYIPYAARNMTNITCPTLFSGCNSNDVTSELVYARVIGTNRCYCVPGNCQNSYLDIEFVIAVTAIANNRYDIIVFLSNDGNTIAPPLAQQCLGWVAAANEGIVQYNTSNCAAWGKFTNFDSDLCGDIDRTSVPVYANISAHVSCANVDIFGQLSIPYILAWHQISTAGCTLNTWAGGVSKCDTGSLSFSGLLAPCETAVCPPADQCYNYSCVAVNGSAVCVKNAFVNASCDDGLFCSTSSKCNATGSCVASTLVDCDPSPVPCHRMICRETTNGSLCIELHAPNGEPCSSGYTCLTSGVCLGGNCSEVPVICTTNTTCTGYACVEGTGCQPFYRTGVSCGPTTECQSHVCNEIGLCVDVNVPLGTPCGQAESACQYGYACDGLGSCAIGDIKPNGTLCSNCIGCQQASYCNGVNLSCPVPSLADCPIINCQVGTCLTNGSCGCSYTALQCSDANACTEDFCDTGTGQCQHPMIECPPIGTPPNQCLDYFCNANATAEPCYSVSRAGQNCTSGNQCLFGVCVDVLNGTECQANPFDPIPPPSSPNPCSYYECDPGFGYQSYCNVSSTCQIEELCYDHACQYNSSALTCECVRGLAKPHPPNTACVTYYCNDSVGWIPLYLDGALCGFSNTTLCRSPDTCYQGACLQNFNDTNTICDEPSSCRNAAYCDGFGGCPERTGRPDGSSCGPYVSFCNTGRICSAGSCVNNYTASGTICGPQLPCCLPDTCDGIGNCQSGDNLPDGTSCGQSGPCGSQNCSSGQCVTVLVNGTLCNASSSTCLASAYCVGDSFVCPDQLPLDNGTLCQVGSGCVSNAFCDGINASCIASEPLTCDDSSHCTSDQCIFNSSSGHAQCQAVDIPCFGNACYPSSCSPSMGCTINATQCFNNNSCATASCVNTSGCVLIPSPIGSPCDDGDLCTINDRCDGNMSCISDPRCLPGQCFSQTCSVGVCTSSPANESMPCTPDTTESCTFSSANCLIGYQCAGGQCSGVFQDTFTQCRPAANDCDAPEYCTGLSACCPPDVNLNNQALCGSGLHTCGADRCVAGVCTAVPSNNNTICNLSTNVCLQSSRCGPSSIDCGPLIPIEGCCNTDTDCDPLYRCNYLHICEAVPQGCLSDGCTSTVGCLAASCNNQTFECQLTTNESFCQNTSICTVASCQPTQVCLSGVRVSQPCDTNANCSRDNSTNSYWSCSTDLAQYPSQPLCATLCVNGTCNFTSDFVPAIAGICGYPPQTGCLYTVIENCCIADTDCPTIPEGNCSYFNCTSNRCNFTDGVCSTASSTTLLSLSTVPTTTPIASSSYGPSPHPPHEHRELSAAAIVVLSVGYASMCCVCLIWKYKRKCPPDEDASMVYYQPLYQVSATRRDRTWYY